LPQERQLSRWTAAALGALSPNAYIACEIARNARALTELPQQQEYDDKARNR
jgi:hypothetical protein